MNKLTKLLSVFVIAGAIGAGVAGVAGCKKSNGHSHKYSYTVDVEDATKHNGVCDCGKNPVLKQDHVDTKDGDGICDLCGAPVNPQQGGDEVTVTSVTVSAAGGATSVAVEGKLQLSAAVAGTGNPAQTVIWKSSDETKATVNASTGEVTGVAEGSVTITATSTVDTSKSGTINLTVTAKGAVDPGPGPGPVEKSKYETLVEQSDKLYNNDFSEAFTAPTFSGTYGSRGVYSTLEGAVSVVNGALTQANGKGVNFNTIIDFGPLATESALEGYMEVKATDTGTAWNLVQFKNDKGSTVFVIGAGTDKTKLAYVAGSGICEKLDGKTNTNVAGAVVTDIAFAKDTVYKIYYKFDLKTGKVNLEINGSVIAVDTEIKSLGGIQLAASNSGGRQVIIDNVVFCGEAMTLEMFKELKTAELNSAYGTYNSESYSADWYAKIGEAKNTGLQEISAAQDMDAVTEAYNKAIKAMKNAPTKELEELYNAKEAYKTTALANYVAYKYTQNKSGYDTAYNKVVAEIDAYSGEISGLAADAKIVAALKALGEVKNDETVVTEAKAAAIAALEAYRADETFESKATEYATALNAAKGLVNAVTFASTAETTKADVDAKLAEITKAETDGKAEIDKVQSDSQLLAKAKEDAIAEISTYGDDKLSAITPGGSVTQDDIDEAKANIATTRNLRTNAIKSATSIEKVQEEVDLAKTNIDSYIAALTETLAQTKERELKTLKEEYDKIIADITDEVVLSILLEDYNGFVGRINGVTGEENKERVTEIRAEGVNLMRVRVARRTSYNTIVAHAAEVKADLFSKAACAAIDEEIKYDINTLTDQSKWSAHMWTIHNASTIVGVDNARDVVIAEIDKIAAAAKAASYEVKISADGLNQDVLIGKIVYGGTLDAVDVNLLPDDKTIDGGKLYTNEACTEEYDFNTKIYDATVLYAKLANATKGERTETFSYADIPVGDKVKDTPLTAADITGKNSFLTLGSGEVRYRLSSEKDDNKNFVQLTGEAFKVTFNGTGTLALSGRGTGSSANAAFAVVDEDGVACELVSVPSGVTEYDNNVYSIAASGHVKITFKVTKPGTYSIVVLRNGETDPITKNGVKSTATFGMGRISAIELNDSYKLQHDVSVVWGTEKVTYHHTDKVTAPNPTGLSDTEKFEYWYYMDGDNEVKWTDGSTLAAGSYSFIAKTSTVAAVESVEVSASAESVEIGGSITLTATAKDGDGNVLEGRTATWDLGGYEYAEVSVDGILTLKSGATVGDTITVTATIGTKTADVTITVAEASALVFDAKDITADSVVAGGTALGNGFFVAEGEGVTAGAGKLTLGGNLGISGGKIRRAIGINLKAGTYNIAVTFNCGGNRTIKIGCLEAGACKELVVSESIAKGNGVTGTVSVTLENDMTIYIGTNNSIDVLKIEITK